MPSLSQKNTNYQGSIKFMQNIGQFKLLIYSLDIGQYFPPCCGWGKVRSAVGDGGGNVLRYFSLIPNTLIVENHF